MGYDAERSRQRAERIVRGSKQVATQAIPTSAVAAVPPATRVVGLIRRIDFDEGVIYWQRLRYSSRPPVVGAYETYGAIEKGYPLECALLEDYAVWVWGDSEPSVMTIPIEAVRSGGVWILQVIFKPDGSEVPADEPMSGCSG